MEELIATKLEYSWNKRATLYKLNRILTKGVHPLSGKEFEVTKEAQIERLKPEYHECIIEGYDIIVISDADTFAERLVFTGFENTIIKGASPYGRTSVVVGGQHTMSIYGGDIESLREPEVYLRRLAQLHNLEFGGIL